MCLDMQGWNPTGSSLSRCRAVDPACNGGVDVMHFRCIFMLSLLERIDSKAAVTPREPYRSSSGDRGAEVRGKGPPGRFGGKRPDL